MATVLIVGTFDTKGAEYQFCKEIIEARGHNTITINAGILGESYFEPTVSAEEVAQAAGTTLQALRDANDRGNGVVTMSKGATQIALKLLEEGKFDGIFSMGGTGGSSLAAAVMAALPVGVPKVLISTAASGNVEPYVGVKDVTLMYSIVDVAGLNSISRQIFTNGAAAICGMVEQAKPPAGADSKPLVSATMYGVTTPCVTRFREKLEENGYEVLVFHATGSGGNSMEALIAGGFIKGVADITTHEHMDPIVQGIHGSTTRMTAAAEAGIPQVVSFGGLDMGTYGPLETVPADYKDRNLHVHNASITIMESTTEERVQVANTMVERLNMATGPTVVFLPLKGISVMDNVDMPFHSPEANQAMFDVIRQGVNNSNVELVELDMHINDPEFADAMSNRLVELLQD